MANDEHVALLKQGAAAWAWRRKNQDVRPDLREAEPSGANLRGTNLGWANLWQADLSGADLWEADFRGANFHHRVG